MMKTFRGVLAGRASTLVVLVMSMGGTVGAAPTFVSDPAPPAPVYALTHARLVTKPGHVIDDGVIVLRDGRIAAVGTGVKIPADARVLDLQGRTVFAGFIDANTSYGQREPAPAKDEVLRIVPQQRLADKLQPVAGDAQVLRGLGFTSVVSQPRYGAFRGQAAVVSTSDEQHLRDVLIEPAVAQTLAFDRNAKDSERYPVFPAGATALLRQTFMDAQWHLQYLDWQRRHRASPSLGEQLELASLEPALRGRQPVLFDATDEHDLERAWRVAAEFKLRWLVNGTGYEYRQVASLKQRGARVILPLNWTQAPKVGTDEEAEKVSLAELEHWQWAPFNPRMLAEAGVPFALTTKGLKEPGSQFWKQVRDAVAHGLDEQVALAALTQIPAELLSIGDRVGSLAPGYRAQLVVADADLFSSAQARIYDVWVDGRRYQLADAPLVDVKNKTAVAKTNTAAVKPPLPGELRYPAGEYGRLGLPRQPQAVLITGATVWTQGPQGRIESADVLIERGRIRAVGQGLQAPASAERIDGRGLHVTPGIIDSHSHIALNRDGMFTESSDHITSEVGNADILLPDDIAIYRQLSDGVTSALLLQGSANPINGQSQTIKLRWGADAEGLKLAGAPPSMKFALGENSKQSNWGTQQRFPLTRMGIQESLREAFAQAQAYAARVPLKNGPPLRRDLRMEATAAIIAGKSTMHVHSYRQSEVAAFLELCGEYAIKPVFHHITEGYKMADEMAAAGAGASAFIDYWGIKMEAEDATIYNAAAMVHRGVLVSLSSDSTGGWMPPRLNLDAAYSVGYGGLSETEALNLVTINSARQMGVSEHIGSLEAGKDADFVIWSDNPLSPRAIAQQTWIDGRRYFDREEDRRERERIAARRAQLIGLIRQVRQ